jgi:hypothetical protein
MTPHCGQMIFLIRAAMSIVFGIGQVLIVHSNAPLVVGGGTMMPDSQNGQNAGTNLGHIAILAVCAASALTLGSTTGAMAEKFKAPSASNGNSGTAKTFRTRGRHSSATVRGLRVEKPSGYSNSIFDRPGNSPRGRVTGVAVDPSDPSGNRTAVRGKRHKISEDNNPIPRDRMLNRGQKNLDDGFAQGNPMVHFRR